MKDINVNIRLTDDDLKFLNWYYDFFGLSKSPIDFNEFLESKVRSLFDEFLLNSIKEYYSLFLKDEKK